MQGVNDWLYALVVAHLSFDKSINAKIRILSFSVNCGNYPIR